jgi:hypothetical protein
MQDTVQGCLPAELRGLSGDALASRLLSDAGSTEGALDFLSTKTDSLQHQLKFQLSSGKGSDHGLLARAREARAKVSVLSSRLHCAHAAVGPSLNVPAASVAKAVESNDQLREQVASSQNLVQTLSALVAVRDATVQLDRSITTGNLVAAAACCQQVDSLLASERLVSLVRLRVRAIDSAASTLDSKRRELQNLAMPLVCSACRIESGAGFIKLQLRDVVSLSTSDGPVPVTTSSAWACLRTLGASVLHCAVDRVVNDLKDDFLGLIFGPEFGRAEGGAWSLDTKDTATNDTATACLRPAGAFNLLSLLQSLQILAKAIQTRLCAGDRELWCAGVAMVSTTTNSSWYVHCSRLGGRPSLRKLTAVYWIYHHSSWSSWHPCQ